MKPILLLFLLLFLDEILMPRGPPPIMQTAFCRILRFACFLVPLCPKRALVWGNCCEQLRVVIFVRVLRSSRVNLSTVNDTNVFCCVWIGSPFIYFSVAVLNSVLQKQCW